MLLQITGLILAQRLPSGHPLIESSPVQPSLASAQMNSKTQNKSLSVTNPSSALALARADGDHLSLAPHLVASRGQSEVGCDRGIHITEKRKCHKSEVLIFQKASRKVTYWHILLFFLQNKVPLPIISARHLGGLWT